MLEPHDRRVLLDALRPPSGYRLDSAIATTYTLDLVALLGAQLSLGVHDLSAAHEAEDGAANERLPSRGVGAAALLQAVRATADRIAVFCQGGAIKAARYRPLLAYLEDSIIEVRAPRGGVFHPKIWVERFQGSSPDDILVRILVATRNITFDRSWDTLLVLEGPLKMRTNAYGRNRPLAELVGKLPSLACGPVSKRVKKLVASLADDLLRVDFEVPAPFEKMEFWPLGLEGKARDPLDIRRDRVLIVSPFVTQDRLSTLGSRGHGHVLVGRPEELECLPAETLAEFQCHVLHEVTDEASDEVPSSSEANAGPAGESAQQPAPTLRGLHAKLYVVDAGWDAHVFTGSANATRAGFGENVEILVQLTGKKSKVGVEAMLTSGKPPLQSVLVPFTPSPQPRENDPVDLALERSLRRAQTALGCAPWVARVTREVSSGEQYEVVLSTKGLELPTELRQVHARPLTIAGDQMSAVAIDGGAASTRFSHVSFQGLTSFFVVRIVLAQAGHEAQAEFVVNAQLEGAPEDRSSRLLQTILQDRASVMKFLYLLLALDPETFGADDVAEAATDAGSKDLAAGGSWDETPLLEALLRALDRDPARLEEIHRTIKDLRSSDGGARLLPDDLDRIWAPVWEAHQKLTSSRRSITEGAQS